MLSARGHGGLGAGQGQGHHHIVHFSQDEELKRRLEKLSRSYDLTTMKIFMTVEALGENNVYSTYDLGESLVEG